MNRPRFLLTGATGFLGSVVVQDLAKHYGPDRLHCLVSAPEQSVRVHSSGVREETAQQKLRELGVWIVEGNLTAFPVFDGPPTSYDVVIHLAADNRKDAGTDVNEQGTENLLRTLGNSLRGRSVVFASTVLTLDRNGPALEPLSETSPTHPRTPYGRSKLAAENLVRELAEDYGYKYTILKLCSLYGPGMKAGLIYELAQLVNRRSFLASIDWPGKASVLYRDDAAQVVRWFATRHDSRNEVFVVASNEPHSTGDMLRAIRSFMGVPDSSVRLPGPFWKLLRSVRWAPIVRSFFPWSLGHMIEDGLYCDTTNLLATCKLRMLPLAEGLARTLPSLQS